MEPMTRLGPGLYRDTRGAIHADVPELLAYFGYADTPHNREVAARVALRAFRQLFPDGTHTIVRRADDAN